MSSVSWLWTRHRQGCDGAVMWHSPTPCLHVLWRQLCHPVQCRALPLLLHARRTGMGRDMGGMSARERGAFSPFSTREGAPQQDLKCDSWSWCQKLQIPWEQEKWEAGFRHLLPTSTIYTGIAISETESGIFLFLTVGDGIKMFLSDIVTIAWARGKTQLSKSVSHFTHLRYGPKMSNVPEVPIFSLLDVKVFGWVAQL